MSKKGNKVKKEGGDIKMTEESTVVVEEQTASTPDEYKPTPEQLAKLQAAMEKGDFAAIANISKEIAGNQKKIEKQKKDAVKAAVEEKQKALAGCTIAVKDRLVALITELRNPNCTDYIDGMDKAELVVFKWDFGSELNTVECKLFKSAAKVTGTGTHKSTGGGGKKVAVSTDELLKEHGEEVIGDKLAAKLSKDVDGISVDSTFNEVYPLSTDGNYRYKIRVALIQIAGLA